jgi:23S rRNA pseudouridine2605 synthase
VFASPVLGAYCYEKEYRVLVASRPDEKQLTAWRSGVVLDDGYKTKPAQVRVTGTHGKGAWMQVILTEGRKRQVREMGRLTGLPVVRIIRVRIGTLQLGYLKPKQWRYLTPEEVAELKGESPSSSQPKKYNRSTRRPPKNRK